MHIISNSVKVSKMFKKKLTDWNNQEYSRRVSESIIRERKAQNEKWGKQSHTIPEWLMILSEEFGEACKIGNEVYFRNGNMRQFRQEIIHTGTVTLAILEAIENEGIGFP